MKEWKVRFKKIMDKEWKYTERSFKSKDAASFFCATAQILAPYAMEFEPYEEEAHV